MRQKGKMNMLQNQITEGVIWKQLLIFFFPILLGSFFQQMYNTVDTVVVGRFVGTTALAAVGASGPLIDLLIGFFTGLASGATVVVSQRYGARDGEGVSRAVHTGVALGMVCGLLIMVVGMAVTPWVLRILGTPEAVMGEAQTYTLIYFTGSLAMVIYNVGSGILRALGDSRRPMIYLIICCLVNIVLDLLFVVGFNMGVAGAGIATVISQIVSGLLVLWHLMRLEGEARLYPRQIRFHKETLSSILRIGIPAGFQSSMYSVSNLIIQSSINSFGEVTVAAFTAHSRMCSVIWMVTGAFGVAITTFVGQNFGAEKYDRVRKSVRVCFGMGALVVLAVMAVLMLCGRIFLGIFTTDPAVIDVGIQLIWYITTFYIIYLPIEVYSGAMRGTGDSLIPAIITCVGVCGLRIVWIMFVVSQWHSVMALALSYGISWGVTSLVFALYYLQGGWLHKRIKALGMTPEK